VSIPIGDGVELEAIDDELTKSPSMSKQRVDKSHPRMDVYYSISNNPRFFFAVLSSVFMAS
jgi:hypothetical protein